MKRMLVCALLMSFGAHARSYDYDCYSYFTNGHSDKMTMDLSVNARRATADIHNESWDENLGGDRDYNYQSRGNLQFVKFGELVVEKALLTGGKRLRDGSWGGIARVEGEAEGGFYQYKFICKLK